MKRVEYYEGPDGNVPFEAWFNKLAESTQGRILRYIYRLASGGGKKNIKPVGDGVFELKIDTGPGFRVYFGEEKKTVIILLLGGDKSTQKRDIKKAKEYWRIYGQES